MNPLIKTTLIGLFQTHATPKQAWEIISRAFPAIGYTYKNVENTFYRFRKSAARIQNPQLYKGDRKRKVTKTAIMLIRHLTDISKGFLSSNSLRIKIYNYIKVRLSNRTIRAIRYKMGYRYRRVRTKPKLYSREARLERLIFAINNLNRDLDKVIFVDETSKQIKKRSLYHLRLPHRYPNAVAIRSRHTRTVHIWGGISKQGPTQFCFFVSNLNQYAYKVILQEFLLPFTNQAYPGQICYLIQDNDSKHSSLTCSKYLETIPNIKWIKIPPYSPDINIIELFWASLKRYIDKKMCRTEEELCHRVRKFLHLRATPEFCSKFINKFPNVMQRIIDNKGDWSGI